MTYEPTVISGPNGTAPPENGEAAARSVRQPLLAVLASAGVASEEDLRSALAEGMDSGERLGEVVLRRGWLDEAGLARVLADQWDLRFLEDASVNSLGGLFDVVSQASPTGGKDFEDMALHDPSDPEQWLLIVSWKSPGTLTMPPASVGLLARGSVAWGLMVRRPASTTG